MKLKLIALDIDGTLTNDEKKITADTLSTLLKFQEQGIRVMLASARPVPGLYSAASELRLGETPQTDNFFHKPIWTLIKPGNFSVFWKRFLSL